MLRRLVNTNTTEFKKPSSREAAETAAPAEQTRPAPEARQPATTPPAGGNGSGLTNSGAGNGSAVASGAPASSTRPVDDGGFLHRTATGDNSYAAFSSDKFTEVKMSIHQQLLTR